MQTIGELIELNERNHPDVVAFADDARRLSYREYGERVRRLGSALHRLGMERQDRVGIFSTNNVEYFELYGACEWSGYIAALYNFRLAPPEVAWLLQDSAPKVVVFEAQFAGLFEALRAQHPGVAHYVCIGGPAPDWALDFETLVASGDPAGPGFRAHPDDEVYLYYTSGTTGKPKGVPTNQQGAIYTATFQGRYIGSDLRVLQATPAFHIGGKGFPLAAMWVGGTVVLQRNFDALRFLEIVQAERVTFTFMVAPMIQAVLDHPRLPEFDLSSLRLVMSASAAIPVPLLRRAIAKMGPIFYISYGATETATLSVLERHELRPDGDARDLRLLGSVGHFIPEIETVLLNDAGQPCAPNEVGEVCARTPIFHGYWNNMVATLEATRGGYFHTGDMGYADEQGYLFLVDRKKDMIISGGENIYSREVEDALYAHAAVCDVAVIGVPDAKWGEAVAAIVVLHEGQYVTEEGLQAFCQQRIARYKCPKRITVVDSLPRLGTGKINKVALREIYRDTAGQPA